MWTKNGTARGRIWLYSIAVMCLVGAGLAYLSLPEEPARSPDVPYVETPLEVIESMLDLAEVGPDDVVYDLGSGDGRMALAAGARGARAVGFELDPELVKLSRKTAEERGLDQSVSFEVADILELDLSRANVVLMFLSPRINRELKPKLQSELPAGSRVVSHIFDMEDWSPDAQETLSGRKIFLWRIAEGSPPTPAPSPGG